MESKYCSACAQKRVLSCFLKNPSANPGTKVFSTCIPCRDKSKKRRALQPLDPNKQSKRRIELSTTTRPIERSNPRPLPVLPPLLDRHPDPIVLPLSESRPLFEARTKPSILPVQHRVQPRPIQPGQSPVQHRPQVPQPIPAIQRQVQPPPLLPVQLQPVLPVQRRIQPQPILPIHH